MPTATATPTGSNSTEASSSGGRRHRGRRTLGVVSAMAVSAALGACASTSPGHGQSATPASRSVSAAATIVIRNFAFSPDDMTVAPGASVTVHNEDNVAHTVSSVAGAFDTGDVGPGQTVRFTAPRSPGTYRYRCDIHQFMTGTLVVRGG